MDYTIYLWLTLLLIPVIILASYAQIRVSSMYQTYSKTNAQTGRTAHDVARTILDTAGLQNVTITKVKGKLTDYYDSKKKVLALSEGNYDSTSIAAIGVAAHEAGHALQDKQNYLPLRLRHLVIHVSNFVSRAFIPMLILSMILAILIPTTGNAGFYIACVAVGVYGLAMLVSLITLPVEFNASRRALQILNDSGILNQEELSGARKVLSAAALTYIASFLYNLVEFLILLLWLLAIVIEHKD